jgi:NAD-dependent DNA ligase
MEMIKKRSLESLTTRNSVPCSENMKQKLDILKSNFDINEMTRKFWEDLIKKTEIKK